MPSSRQKLAAAFVVGVLLLHAVARRSNAQATIIADSGASGGHVALPAPAQNGKPSPNKSGLTISIDTVWLPADGYRPVRITVTPVAPASSDRTLQIRLTPMGERGYQPESSIQVTRTVDIQAGSTPAATTIPVPQWAAWLGLKLDVFEDGKRIDELSAGDVFPNSEISIGGGSAPVRATLRESPAILLLGGSLKDADAAKDRILFPGRPGNGFRRFGNPAVFREARLMYSETALPAGTALGNGPSLPPIAGLPEQWLDYSGIDVVLLPLDKLNDLVTNHPSQWAAIRSMVNAGGGLWVYGVGDDWQRLPALEELLDLGGAGPGPSGAAIDPLSRGWKAPDPKIEPTSPPPDSGVTDAAGETPKPPVANRPSFVSRPHGRGQIVAIKPENIFADGEFDWDWLLSTVGDSRLQWTARSGVVLDPAELQSNASNFWQFLIPGVGLTPVLQFQILISLFVIAIGPVNYYLLRRWQRLNLMPITVGVGATLVTLSLFAYAFIHDGLGVRLRARSFTELDQRRGEAVSWSRLSYYAGISPSKGLTFSGETAVYPLRTGSEQASMQRDKPSPMAMEWVDAEPNAADPLPSQHFSSDWLPARVPTQFVTVRTRKTAARLNVIVGPQGSISKIENRLGTRILSLIVTDSAGKSFGAEKVNDDASATLAPIESSEARAHIAKLILENDLQFPAGAQISAFQSSQGYSRYSNMGRYGMNSNVTAPNEAETILERSLHHASDLPPHSFVAITETSPEVELGTPAAHEESSLHVIVGRW